MKGCFENNRVGQLQQRVWDASDEEIDAILQSYEVPSPGEMDRPGCYIQNTVRAVQEEKKKRNDVVLIPLGSTEVHGLHCASSQDTLQAGRICEAMRRFTARQGREVNLAMSPWLYGNHPKHHVGMLGTMPISPSVLEKLLVDVMFGLWADGYRKFIFVNNHAQHWIITAAIDTFALRYPMLPFYAVAFDWCAAVWQFFQTKAQGRAVRGRFHSCRRAGDLADAAAGPGNGRHEARRGHQAARLSARRPFQQVGQPDGLAAEPVVERAAQRAGGVRGHAGGDRGPGHASPRPPRPSVRWRPP